jgi:hypothetical protein
MPSQLDHQIVAVAERGGQLTVCIRFVLPVGLSEQVAELIGLALRQFHGGTEGAAFQAPHGGGRSRPIVELSNTMGFASGISDLLRDPKGNLAGRPAF